MFRLHVLRERLRLEAQNIRLLRLDRCQRRPRHAQSLRRRHGDGVAQSALSRHVRSVQLGELLVQRGQRHLRALIDLKVCGDQRVGRTAGQRRRRHSQTLTGAPRIVEEVLVMKVRTLRLLDSDALQARGQSSRYGIRREQRIRVRGVDDQLLLAIGLARPCPEPEIERHAHRDQQEHQEETRSARETHELPMVPRAFHGDDDARRRCVALDLA